MPIVNFDTTEENMDLIYQIVSRGEQMLKEQDMPKRDRVNMMMDITACHCNGNPLKLEAMLNADDFNFAHDFFGIQSHIDRETGKMTDCFLPRFTDTAAASAAGGGE